MESSVKQNEEPIKIRDARPALPISLDSLWERAAGKLEEFTLILDRCFEQEGYRVWIMNSKPGEYPLYINVESWVSIDETELTTTFDRTSLKISIEVHPYRENPFVYTVNLQGQKKAFQESHWDLTEADAKEFVDYLFHGREKPRFFLPRTSGFERFIGAFIPGVGNEPENKLIPEARPTYITAASVTALLGLATIGLGALAASDATIPLIVLGTVLVGTAMYIVSSRASVDAVPKQPVRSPRREFRFDSWHVSVPGAARNENFDSFKNRLESAISRRAPEIQMTTEVHQQLSPRGIDERARWVITRNQATLHIHVYPFGDDVFVGWESYLNWQRWEESSPVSAPVRNGRTVTYKTLDVGAYIPNDFDLIDAELLAESMHRILVDEIKLWLKEKEIEAELDFRIVRGDRSSALTQGKEKAN